MLVKGKLLAFDANTQTGIVSAEDGARYEIQPGDWRAPTPPQPGMDVDFVPAGTRATQVYVTISESESGSKKLAAALLAFFLGGLGIHKFYLGYKKQGWTMLIVFILGFILLGLPSMLMQLIAFIEAILYISKSDAEFQRIYVQGKKPWF